MCASTFSSNKHAEKIMCVMHAILKEEEIKFNKYYENSTPDHFL